MATPKHQCKCRKTATELEQKLAERDAQLAALSARVNDIEHKMALANRQIVGPKSERMPTPEQEAKKREGKTPARGGYANAKKRKENAEALASLPTTLVPHPIAENERRARLICPPGRRYDVRAWILGRIQLHALLAASGPEEPYVLVGHSMGGVNVRLLASEHLDEVAGMVLVDAVGDDQFSRWFVLLPEAIKTDFRTHLPDLHEGLDFDTYVAGVTDMAASSRSLGDRPLAVVSHGKPQRAPGASAATRSEVERVWADMQNRLCGLSSNCVHVVAANSGHFVQLDEPEVVVAAVRAVVDAARTHAAVDGTALSRLGSVR